MKIKTLLVAAGLTLAAGTASADGIVQKCFAKVLVGAKYETSQHKVRDARTQYVDRGNGRVDLVYMPAWYEESRRKTRDARYVLKPVACN